MAWVGRTEAMRGCSEEVTVEAMGGRRAVARLDDGVVVRPGGFEAVGQLLNGLEAIAFPEEEAYECCCETACYPNQILHACPLGECYCVRCEGWMQERGMGLASGWRGRDSTLERLWTGFGLGGRWGMVLGMRRRR